MKRVHPRPDWPASWKSSYLYDRDEVYGELQDPGYAYAYANRRERTLELLTEAVPLGARVLDIAAAQGNFSLMMAEHGYDVTWNDLREDLIGYVKEKYEHGHLSFAPGNAFELRFADRFDAALITEVIEHTAHPDEFLKRVAMLVRPGGHIVMTTPNGGYFRNTLPRFSDCRDLTSFEARQFGPNADDHLFLLHVDEILSLAGRACLTVDKLALFTNPLTNGHVKMAPLLRVLPRGLVAGVERLSVRLPDAVTRRLMVQTAVRFVVQGVSGPRPPH